MSSYEYHQILQFLYFEGYADSYESAEYLFEQLSDDEFEELNEARRKLAHSFPLKPSEKRSVANIGRMNDGDFSVPPGGSVRVRSSRKVKPEPEEQKPRRRRTDMSKVIVAHYLFDEGYAETIESAELIAESISKQWANQILDEAHLILESARKKQKLVQNASDALIRTSTSRSASIQKRIQDLKDRS